MPDDREYETRLSSPFGVFIRKPHGFSDTDLLTLFGLELAPASKHQNPSPGGVYLGEAGDWTMIADTWGYMLWSMPSTRDVVRMLARNHEIFTYLEGDCDRSFDYSHYRNGKLVREYIVSSPGYVDRHIQTNHGKLIEGESDILARDGDNIGLDVASLLGIKTCFYEDEVRRHRCRPTM